MTLPTCLHQPVTDAEDIAALGRIIDQLRTELLESAAPRERRHWLRRAIEEAIDIRGHIALQAGIELSA